jgi:hypothetical protein
LRSLLKGSGWVVVSCGCVACLVLF